MEEIQCERCGKPASVHTTKCVAGQSDTPLTVQSNLCDDCAATPAGDIEELQARFAEAIHPIPVKKWVVSTEDGDHYITAIIEDQFLTQGSAKELERHAHEHGISGFESLGSYEAGCRSFAKWLRTFADIDQTAIDNLIETGMTSAIQIGSLNLKKLAEILRIPFDVASAMITSSSNTDPQES